MSRVKELEWSELSDGWIAHTPFGSYEVNGSVLRGSLGTCYDYFSSEHAKVAAQADYEQRILSTLKPEGEQISGNINPWDDVRKAVNDLHKPYTPTAWLHTLHMEGDQEDERLSFYRDNPWGRPGIDYSVTFTVTSEPLVRGDPL